MDRRVRRTRRQLREALIDLILERGYDRVTVQDIADRADVGRSTFYANFPGKDSLLLSGLEEIEAAFTESGDNGPPLAPLRQVFHHAAEHRRLYRAVIGTRAAALAFRIGQARLSQLLAGRLATKPGPARELAVAFVVNTLIGVITWWLDNDVPWPPDIAYDRFESLAMHGLGSLDGQEVPDPARPGLDVGDGGRDMEP